MGLMLEGMELSQVATTQMKVSPRLVAMNHVLELSSIELQELISAELGENPALEMMDKPTCPRCGAAQEGPICAHCLSRQSQNGESPDGANVEQVGTRDREDYYFEEGPSLSRRDTDDDFDPVVHVAAEMSLPERLIRELGAILPLEQMPIAEFLVGNLDERGFLECSVEEAARILEVSTEEVRAVLRELQAQEPVG